METKVAKSPVTLILPTTVAASLRFNTRKLPLSVIEVDVLVRLMETSIYLPVKEAGPVTELLKLIPVPLVIKAAEGNAMYVPVEGEPEKFSVVPETDAAVILPAKYAFPVVVAPPEMVRPVV